MWITEIRHKVTGAVLARIEHGSNWTKANDMHNYYSTNWAIHRIHLIWEEE